MSCFCSTQKQRLRSRFLWRMCLPASTAQRHSNGCPFCSPEFLNNSQHNDTIGVLYCLLKAVFTVPTLPASWAPGLSHELKTNLRPPFSARVWGGFSAARSPEERGVVSVYNVDLWLVSRREARSGARSLASFATVTSQYTLFSHFDSSSNTKDTRGEKALKHKRTLFVSLASPSPQEEENHCITIILTVCDINIHEEPDPTCCSLLDACGAAARCLVLTGWGHCGGKHRRTGICS